ncbi:MAG: hypothetical protein FRX48_09165 [Lasallia pustulata]|uniref:Uncharacterized protein n=1 Tax=Lasallia pustulata TaxID=136370 RepID=A0A5M8PCR3_9LECA|nr:MAG: hypothetical protein FRX48_09165 [Lasallia pustulata]
MSDIWLAIAAEERTASSSSSFFISGRAAARASRPRPWVQSQTRVRPQAPSTTTSKPRSPSEPSTVIFVGGSAARPQPAAWSSTRVKSQAPLTTQASKSLTPSEPSTAIYVGGLAARPQPAVQSSTRVRSQAPSTTQASKPRTTSTSTAAPISVGGLAARPRPAAQSPISDEQLAATRQAFRAQSEASKRLRATTLHLQLDQLLPESQSPPAKTEPLDEFWADCLAQHVQRAKRANVSRIPAPVGLTLATDRMTTCPCGVKFCLYEKSIEKSCANAAGNRKRLAERTAALRAERAAAVADVLRPRKISKRLDKLEVLASDLARQLNRPSAPRPSVEQTAAPVQVSVDLTSRESGQSIDSQPAVPSQPRGILRKPGQKNKAAKGVSFGQFVECRETVRWIGDVDVATGTPADQCFTDDEELVSDSRYIHVHVARPWSPRPASQARFGFGAEFPPSMVMRGWECW